VVFLTFLFIFSYVCNIFFLVESIDLFLVIGVCFAVFVYLLLADRLGLLQTIFFLFVCGDYCVPISL